ncbi:MAG: polymerase, sigma-24 subunit, subfamily [Microbacteriaceae bacterium]|jgi:RNA polymerase sigma factor (sigma-70 family)|nr:polymerase, sigma-24 subunit, subfamily [Microbacteriaceae bacterium]
MLRTDAELLAAAGKDASAFRELYDRYCERIHRFQLGRTRNRDAALDLTAETFAQVWLSRDRFRDLADGSAAPWLYAIARHVLIASVRKGRLEEQARTQLGLIRSEAPAEPSSLWVEGLDEAFADLPPELRQAIELRIVEDLPYAEVAAAIGTTSGAARVRVHRGLNALRERLLQTTEAPQ